MAGVTLHEIAAAVRAGRGHRGLSQAQLAELAGVSRHTIVRLEQGRPGASLDTVLRVLALLGVELTLVGPPSAAQPGSAAGTPPPAIETVDLEVLLRAHRR